MIYGVERGVFRIFLRFLYGAPLEPDSMALEELIALLAVADRWVGSGCHNDRGETILYFGVCVDGLYVYLPFKV